MSQIVTASRLNFKKTANGSATQMQLLCA